MNLLVLLDEKENITNNIEEILKSCNIFSYVNFVPSTEQAILLGTFYTINSQTQLVTDINLEPHKYIELDVDVSALHFDTIHFCVAGKAQTKNTSLVIEISNSQQNIGRILFTITNQWKTSSNIIPVNNKTDLPVRIKIMNSGKNSVDIAYVRALFKFVINKQSIKQLFDKHKCNSIITNSAEIQKICSKTWSTTNINICARNNHTSPEVSILTPTYNGLKYLTQCASNLLANTKHEQFEWLILDDYSTDGTAEFLEQLTSQHQNIRVFKAPKQIENFSKANNFLAKQSKNKFIIFLNNDCYVQPHWLDCFLERMYEDPTVGAIGGLLLFPNTTTIQHCGVIFYGEAEASPGSNIFGFLPGHVRHMLSLDENSDFVNRPRLYQALTAACSGVRRRLFDILNGFDENYIFGYEDVDFYLRLGNLGYKILFDPNSIAYHHESGTFNDVSRGTKSQEQYEHNKNVFIRRWGHLPCLDMNKYLTNNNLNIYEPKTLDSTVVYVPTTRGCGHDIYRTDHAVEGLVKNGVDVRIVNWREGAELPDAKVDIIMFQRCISIDRPFEMLDKAKHQYPNIVCGYDIDDYLFDETVMKEANLRDGLIDNAKYHEEFMRNCDFFTTTTTYLAKAIEDKFKKPTFVVPNSLSDGFLSKFNNNKYGLTITYASGSNSHDNDFALLIEPLEKILRKYNNVVLQLMGHLRIPDSFLKRFANQIVVVPFVDFNEFPKYLTKCDINLAPLLKSNFCQAKSPLKYIEAGAFQIPTLASNTFGYQEVIKNGSNGFLCDGEKDWFDKIVMLIENKNLRMQIGAMARKDVVSNYTTQKTGTYLSKIFRGMIHPPYQRT